MSTPQPNAGLASWLQRVGATLLDAVPLIIATVAFFAIWGEKAATNDGASWSVSVEITGLPAIVLMVLFLAWFVVNWVVGQGTSGQTIGKKIVGIAIVGADTGRPLGPGLTIGRQLIHIVDVLPCFLGLLWPLWDAEKRTFADMATRSRAVRVTSGEPH